MFKAPFRKFLAALAFVTIGYQHGFSQNRDYIKIPYPDTLKTIGIKIDVWSVLANHVMMGVEVPLKKDRFFEFNMGMSGLFNGNNYYYDESETIYKGFLMRTGFKLPIIYTTAMSMVYLMPEYAYSGFRVNGFDYNTGNLKEYNVRSQALLLNFGYRHVNPRSGFFYDLGIGYGLGFTNHGAYGYYSYSFIINNQSFYGSNEKPYSGLASSFRGSIGWVLKKKNN